MCFRYSGGHRINHAFSVDLITAVNTPISSYLVLFEVSPLEVIAKLGVKVVPKAVGLSSVGPYEGVSASTGHADDIDVSHICIASFDAQLLWQLHLDRLVLYGPFSVTQPRESRQKIQFEEKKKKMNWKMINLARQLDSSYGPISVLWANISQASELHSWKNAAFIKKIYSSSDYSFTSTSK